MSTNGGGSNGGDAHDAGVDGAGTHPPGTNKPHADIQHVPESRLWTRVRTGAAIATAISAVIVASLAVVQTDPGGLVCKYSSPAPKALPPDATPTALVSFAHATSDEAGRFRTALAAHFRRSGQELFGFTSICRPLTDAEAERWLAQSRAHGAVIQAERLGPHRLLVRVLSNDAARATHWEDDYKLDDALDSPDFARAFGLRMLMRHPAAVRARAWSAAQLTSAEPNFLDRSTDIEQLLSIASTPVLEKDWDASLLVLDALLSESRLDDADKQLRKLESLLPGGSDAQKQAGTMAPLTPEAIPQYVELTFRLIFSRMQRSLHADDFDIAAGFARAARVRLDSLALLKDDVPMKFRAALVRFYAQLGEASLEDLRRARDLAMRIVVSRDASNNRHLSELLAARDRLVMLTRESEDRKRWDDEAKQAAQAAAERSRADELDRARKEGFAVGFDAAEQKWRVRELELHELREEDAARFRAVIIARNDEIAANKEEIAANNAGIAAKTAEIVAKTAEIAANNAEIAANKQELALKSKELEERKAGQKVQNPKSGEGATQAGRVWRCPIFVEHRGQRKLLPACRGHRQVRAGRWGRPR